jgi:hypothetical protein
MTVGGGERDKQNVGMTRGNEARPRVRERDEQDGSVTRRPRA